MSAPDLAKLFAEAKRWPTDWKPDMFVTDCVWMGSFSCADSDGETQDVETDQDSGYSAQLGKFLTDAVNAIPAIAALTAERDSLRAHLEAQDARIKGLEATIAGKVRL